MPVAAADISSDEDHHEEPSKESKYVWPLWKLILIALPQLGVQVLWAFIGPNSASYMRHLGLPDWLATLNGIAGPITGFFTGPLVGATSDTLTSKWGRRRPVILAGLISTWIAGTLFSASEHLAPKGTAKYFAAPMYWVMDVTINVLQTPHRALVADLASEDQQVPMQVVFVFMMAIGNFVAFSILKIYESPVDHMLELMVGICLLNTLCIAVQFSIAKETPLKRDPNAPKQSACAPVQNVLEAVRHSPCLLYQLAGVQCLVWIGNTSWNLYALQWFGNTVFEGDETAKDGTDLKNHYKEGVSAFSQAGQGKAVMQLFSTLAIIALLLKTTVRPRLVYAPCIYIGAVVSILAAFVVGHKGMFAIICMVFSIMPETGSFAIPFGLVATLNARAMKEGKSVSTALQMALLNCCVTVGQQLDTMTLAAIQTQMSLTQSLPYAFLLSAVAQAVGGTGALFLDDRPDEDQSGSDMENGNESSEDATESQTE